MYVYYNYIYQIIVKDVSMLREIPDVKMSSERTSSTKVVFLINALPDMTPVIC